jgi:tRNA:m4X modification enzyme
MCGVCIGGRSCVVREIGMDAKTLKKTIKKRLRDGESTEDLSESWTKCHYFMKNKSRFCNLDPVANSLFCGNHRPTDESYTPRILKDAQFSGCTEIFRIPCPIDPTHTIFNYNLEAHKKICNTGTRLALLEREPYYQKDCNSGANLPSNTDPFLVSDVNPNPPSATVDVELLLRKVQECYQKYVEMEIQEPFTEIPSSLNQEELFKLVAGGAVAFDRVRHAHQDVQIACQMATESMFPTNPSSSKHHVYVELGAGKGMLGLTVKSAAEQCCPGRSSLVMVERTGVHRKADKTLRENSDLAFTRIRMDIRDCYLAGLPGIAPTLADPSQEVATPTRPSVVLVAKHLCGLATDITLRSLESLQLSAASSSESSPTEESFYGVCIATCCHHACDWRDYINPDWLLSCGFTSHEFKVMTHWSGWAHTVGNGVRLAKEGDKRPTEPSPAAEGEESVEQDDKNEHSIPATDLGHPSHRPRGLSYEDMSRVGKMVKRILDHGRVLYLRAMGFAVCQRRYCDKELSPECYLILATRGPPAVGEK